MYSNHRQSVYSCETKTDLAHPQLKINNGQLALKVVFVFQLTIPERIYGRELKTLFKYIYLLCLTKYSIRPKRLNSIFAHSPDSWKNDSHNAESSYRKQKTAQPHINLNPFGSTCGSAIYLQSVEQSHFCKQRLHLPHGNNHVHSSLCDDKQRYFAHYRGT